MGTNINKRFDAKKAFVQIHETRVSTPIIVAIQRGNEKLKSLLSLGIALDLYPLLF